MNRPAVDPAATGDQLATLAAQHPELQSEIALHPNAYDGLLDWIAAYGDDAGKAAVGYRRSLGTAPAAPTESAAPVPPPPPAGLPEFAAPAEQTVLAAPAATPAAKPKRRLKAPLIAGIAVALVLGLGGGAWAVVRAITGGASTPEAAAEKLVGSLLNGDLVGLATVVAPSEASVLQESMKSLASVQVSGDDKAMQDSLAALTKAVTITSERVEYETEQIADKVAVVRMVSGRFTVDGDPDQVADALMDVIGLSFELNRMQYGDYYSDDEWETVLKDARDQLAEELAGELPYVFDAADVADLTREGKSPLAVVAVDEGGWYVSPLLSMAEFAVSAGGSGYPVGTTRPIETVHRGRQVAEAQRFDSPQAAADGTARAVEDFARTLDPLDLAEVLPLPERRLVSLYGEAFAEAFIAPSGLQSEQVRIDRFEIDPVVNGDRASAGIADLTMSDDYGNQWRIRGVCIDNGYSESCLDDAIDQEFSQDRGGPGWTARDLGLDDPKLILVRENGGWLISPLATVAELTAHVSVAMSELWGR